MKTITGSSCYCYHALRSNESRTIMSGITQCWLFPRRIFLQPLPILQRVDPHVLRPIHSGSIMNGWAMRAPEDAPETPRRTSMDIPWVCTKTHERPFVAARPHKPLHSRGKQKVKHWVLFEKTWYQSLFASLYLLMFLTLSVGIYICALYPNPGPQCWKRSQNFTSNQKY